MDSAELPGGVTSEVLRELGEWAALIVLTYAERRWAERDAA